MKCTRCKETIKKGSGYPIINQKVYCSSCFFFLKWKNKIKKEEEKRKCQKE